MEKDITICKFYTLIVHCFIKNITSFKENIVKLMNCFEQRTFPILLMQRNKHRRCMMVRHQIFTHRESNCYPGGLYSTTCILTRVQMPSPLLASFLLVYESSWSYKTQPYLLDPGHTPTSIWVHKLRYWHTYAYHWHFDPGQVPQS